jgi:hypothetical protein
MASPPTPNQGEHQGNTLSSILNHWMRSVFSLDGRSAMYMDLSAHLTKNLQHQVTRDGAKLHMMSVESLLPVVRPHMESGGRGLPPPSPTMISTVFLLPPCSQAHSSLISTINSKSV